ncbi:gas vesicle accessory protein GvpU [Metabacillus sp. RGM 3146]|uniref:gas vesicle accessory protein GvpU n=1 Tax=Metabacillus sp. RGM 3146 TaxID=3401092 RepID=UPI003B9B5435
MSQSQGTELFDPILEAYIVAANHDDFTLDITLSVNGLLVSGTLISAWEYFDKLSALFEKGTSISRDLSERFKKASELGRNSNSTAFIHLKDTRIFCGDENPTPSGSVFLWRGKLDQVDGFFIGKISQ